MDITIEQWWVMDSMFMLVSTLLPPSSPSEAKAGVEVVVGGEDLGAAVLAAIEGIEGALIGSGAVWCEVVSLLERVGFWCAETLVRGLLLRDVTVS